MVPLNQNPYINLCLLIYCISSLGELAKIRWSERHWFRRYAEVRETWYNVRVHVRRWWVLL